VQAGAYLLLGVINFLRGQLDEALQLATRARKISRQLGGFVYLDLGIDLIFLYNALIRADYGAFERYWRNHLPRYEQLRGVRQWLACYLYMQGRALWLQDRLAEAQEIHARMVAAERPQDIPENHIVRAMMSGLLPRWADVTYHLEKDPNVLLIVRDTKANDLRWLECRGTARLVASPDWAWLLPEGTAKGYVVIRVTPRRMDLVDEGQGCGARETLDL
jgi:tetratricopeptide (TPR) repeat protein